MLLSTGAVASASSAPQPPMAETFRVAFFNVYLGLSATAHQDAVNRHIARIQPTILGLSEINNGDKSYVQTTMATLHGLPNVVVHTQTGTLKQAFLTSYPILSNGQVAVSLAGEFPRPPIWVELDMGSGKRLLVYVMHTEAWCMSTPCDNVARPTLEFKRAVEWKRVQDDIAARKTAAHEVIVMGDQNDDPLTPQTASFASSQGTADTDITYPLDYSLFPDRQYTDAGLTVLEPTDTDGSRNTIWTDAEGGPNSALTTPLKLDYIGHSSGVTVAGHEVLSSEVADQTAGLTKPGTALPAGDSFVASDHKLVFADMSI